MEYLKGNLILNSLIIDELFELIPLADPSPRLTESKEPQAAQAYPVPERVIVERIIVQGDQGERGERGIQGLIGPVGPAGPKGERGDKGDKGDVGERGEPGPIGATGADGSQGPKGDRGERGERGEQGIQGPQGERGLTGETGAIGSIGPEGKQGPQGPKGEKGDTGPEGKQGPQGSKGEKGDQGIPGPQGIQGPPGSAGGTDQTIQFNSGSTFSGSTNLIYDYINNILSGTVAKFSIVTSSNSLVSETITIVGTASLSQIANQSYIKYNNSLNKVEILPGLFVKGNIETTASLSASAVTASTGQFNSLSASVYYGLPELYRIITTSSIQLNTIQSSVFAKNTVSSYIEITLPDAAQAKAKEYYFIKSDNLSGSVRILPTGSNSINGKPNFDLNGPYHSVTLITDGIDWFVF